MPGLKSKPWHCIYRLVQDEHFFLLIIHYSILHLNVSQLLEAFLYVCMCWCTVAVCCADSDMLIPELLYESVPPFHLLSRPQPSRLISAWLWWTHTPSVLGRTFFWGNSTKMATVIGSTHPSAPKSHLAKNTHMRIRTQTHMPVTFRLPVELLHDEQRVFGLESSTVWKIQYKNYLLNTK